MHVLRKFLEGLIFGTGLAIAFVVVWIISMAFVIPRVMESATTHSTAPKFENPTDAQVAAPDPSVAGSPRDFSFFKQSGERMKIPQGGGVSRWPSRLPPRAQKGRVPTSSGSPNQFFGRSERQRTRHRLSS